MWCIKCTYVKWKWELVHRVMVHGMHPTNLTVMVHGMHPTNLSTECALRKTAWPHSLNVNNLGMQFNAKRRHDLENGCKTWITFAG